MTFKKIYEKTMWILFSAYIGGFFGLCGAMLAIECLELYTSFINFVLS